MDGAAAAREGNIMAEEESLLVSPPTQDAAVHVRDYLRFTQIFKWGAVVCLIIGLIVLMILK
jgi:hypothetical protein